MSVYLQRDIITHMIVEGDTFQNLQDESPSWKPRRAKGLVLV